MRTLEQVQETAIHHMNSGSLELGASVQSAPVSCYTSSSNFAHEITQIIRRRPMPLVASDKITNVGDFFAVKFMGAPLVAVRNEDGTAKVFFNVCRHRGATLAHEGAGQNCKKLVCPFHGWSYQLNGSVDEIAGGDECFPKLAKEAFRLKQVPSYEYAGMIWVTMDETHAPLERNFAQIKDDLPALGFLPSFSLPEHILPGNFNWKVGVEAFLEVYHFAHTHAPYLAELEFPNLSLIDAKEENCRVVIPLKIPENKQPLLQWAQVMYFIFPASFLLFYSDHVALISVVPIDIDRSELRYTPLVPGIEGRTSPVIKEKVDFLKVILAQDVAVLEGVQSGLHSGANSRFTFTRLEAAVSKFHQDLRETPLP